mmetsp:Transcript_45363/g.130108  ORF Transcript_45363/g.130108 Transcript_45363/m.130108 type:complete len:220 (+) Transcript_45363:152-811(+)
MLTDEIHLPCSWIQDCSMQLQATILHGVPDDRGVDQKLLNGVEGVQLRGHPLNLQLTPSCGLKDGCAACIANCLHATGHDLIENMAQGFRRQLIAADLLQCSTNDFVSGVANNDQHLRRKACDRELQGDEQSTASMSCDGSHALLNEHLSRFAVEDLLIWNPHSRRTNQNDVGPRWSVHVREPKSSANAIRDFRDTPFTHVHLLILDEHLLKPPGISLS